MIPQAKPETKVFHFWNNGGRTIRVTEITLVATSLCLSNSTSHTLDGCHVTVTWLQRDWGDWIYQGMKMNQVCDGLKITFFCPGSRWRWVHRLPRLPSKAEKTTITARVKNPQRPASDYTNLPYKDERPRTWLDRFSVPWSHHDISRCLWALPGPCCTIWSLAVRHCQQNRTGNRR